MRRAVIAAVVLAALAVAPAAAAKEITSVKVCGADRCVTSRDATLLQGLMNGGGTGSAPQHPAGAIRLRSRVGEPGGGAFHFTNWWVPGTGLLLVEDGGWITLPDRVAGVLETVSTGLRPYPARRLGLPAAAPAPAPARPAPATDEADGGVDWLLVGGLCVIAAIAAGGLALVLRRRPGGATP
jgi:hypothetical protein